VKDQHRSTSKSPVKLTNQLSMTTEERLKLPLDVPVSPPRKTQTGGGLLRPDVLKNIR